MKIETSLSETVHVHDPIRFKSIQTQVYEAIEAEFPDVSYRLNDSGLLIFTVPPRTDVAVEIITKPRNKKRVKLTVYPSYVDKTFASDKYPKLSLPFNKEVGKRFKKFCEGIRSAQRLEDKADTFEKIDQTKIRNALKAQLETKRVTISFFTGNPFEGIPPTFYAHPKENCPSDGVLLALEADGKLTPFWNGSTKRRTDFYHQQTLEQAVGKYPTDLNGMKEKLVAAEEFQQKVDAFDINSSPVLLKLLDLYNRGDELLKEFQQI